MSGVMWVRPKTTCARTHSERHMNAGWKAPGVWFKPVYSAFPRIDHPQMGNKRCGGSLGATVSHSRSYCSSRRAVVGNIGCHIGKDVGYKRAVLHQKTRFTNTTSLILIVSSSSTSHDSQSCGSNCWPASASTLSFQARSGSWSRSPSVMRPLSAASLIQASFTLART